MRACSVHVLGSRQRAESGDGDSTIHSLRRSARRICSSRRERISTGDGLETRLLLEQQPTGNDGGIALQDYSLLLRGEPDDEIRRSGDLTTAIRCDGKAITSVTLLAEAAAWSRAKSLLLAAEPDDA